MSANRQRIKRLIDRFHKHADGWTTAANAAVANGTEKQLLADPDYHAHWEGLRDVIDELFALAGDDEALLQRMADEQWRDIMRRGKNGNPYNMCVQDLMWFPFAIPTAVKGRVREARPEEFGEWASHWMPESYYFPLPGLCVG